jgi:hypothetical protein
MSREGRPHQSARFATALRQARPVRPRRLRRRVDCAPFAGCSDRRRNSCRWATSSERAASRPGLLHFSSVVPSGTCVVIVTRYSIADSQAVVLTEPARNAPVPRAPRPGECPGQPGSLAPATTSGRWPTRDRPGRSPGARSDLRGTVESERTANRRHQEAPNDRNESGNHRS